MNQKGFVNIILIIVVVALIGAGAYFVMNRQAQPIPVPPVEVSPTGPITVSGEITCLPKRGTGSQTMECAIGLHGQDGKNYGLQNVFALDLEYKFSTVGLRVEVSGTFSPKEMKGPDGNTYDVAGVIDVISIREREEMSENDCIISGCNNEICSEEPLTTICVVLPEHACYRNAQCERQENGKCGWTMTEALKSCLDKR